MEYKDILAFHPGYYLAEIIEDMGISQAEFATRLGTTPKTLSQLINGQVNLSNDLAKKLSTMLGTSVDVWLNLQSNYDQKVIEIQKEIDFDEQIEIVKQIDYRYFVDVVSLPKTNDVRKKIEFLCNYFMIADLRIMISSDYLVNFRRSSSSINEKNIINANAWIQTAINIAKKINVKSFDAELLKQCLPEIRKMTLLEPSDFIPRLRDLFADCGVAFVLLPHLKNSCVNGAVKWFENNKVVLAMNNRGLDSDKFWFSLFHEIRHVLQQKVTKVFVNGSVDDVNDINDKLEDDANKFAADYLIPPIEYRRFSPTKFTSDAEIIDFARKIGIQPGIVAGRLQHDNIIGQNRCSKLKEKYVFDF